ncbi:hypothetical protein D3C71_1632750 [compost metagenome]
MHGTIIAHLQSHTSVCAAAIGRRKLHHIALGVLLHRVAQFIEQPACHPLHHVGIALSKGNAGRHMERGVRSFGQAQQQVFNLGRELAHAQRQGGRLALESIDHIARRAGQAVVQGQKRSGLYHWRIGRQRRHGGHRSSHANPYKLVRIVGCRVKPCTKTNSA